MYDNPFAFNLKATETQASLGVSQLKKLNYFSKKRRENYEKYKVAFEGLKDYFFTQEATKNSDPNWFSLLVTLQDKVKFSRLELVKYLEENNIQTRPLFAGNMVRQPSFSSLIEGEDYRVVGSLKNTDKIMNDSFQIGLHPAIKDKDISFVIDKIARFVKSV